MEEKCHWDESHKQFFYVKLIGVGGIPSHLIYLYTNLYIFIYR